MVYGVSGNWLRYLVPLQVPVGRPARAELAPTHHMVIEKKQRAN
jgi:hypothetical protein